MNLFITKSDRLKKEINIKVKFITFYKFYVTEKKMLVYYYIKTVIISLLAIYSLFTVAYIVTTVMKHIEIKED